MLDTISIQCPHCNKHVGIRIPMLVQLRQEVVRLRHILKAKGVMVPLPNTYGNHLDIFLTSCVLPDTVVNEEISGPILLEDHTNRKVDEEA